ncbi:pyridoxamine 5'-phosphate oxidase family protein [Labilibaculum sp. K2S]|uniref:pyridoxamine 5'-phosphate oxidase family protein n=1 Tax=Labilibaculum sp. K2S TaxID=3056386 RepID=UPI0025A48A6C|nr:pyridoxamine 5'-phosphate oxidase family protein [Labilibaculum sp. K2S]MDM8162136.1 pyridoxamine 5'-phosphate oxidase family protein [Labilibaculum sp. K2S]
MKDLIKLLNQHKDLALATVNDQGSPKVRIFRIMQLNEQELFFSTAKNKEVYLQLKENPKIEMVSWHDQVSIRVAGTAFFDVSDEMQLKIFEESKILQDIYQSVENPNLTFFRVKMEWVELFDLNSIPPQRKFFDRTDPSAE